MGRHSAPDAPDVPDAELSEPDSARVLAPARHAAPHDPAAEPATASAEGPGDGAPVVAGDELAPGSRGDLQLLRREPGLRVRCAGAVVLAFLIYTVVLILLGRVDVYLIWVWVPTVVSGVAVGGLLDGAHKSRAQRPSASEEQPRSGSDKQQSSRSDEQQSSESEQPRREVAG